MSATQSPSHPPATLPSGYWVTSSLCLAGEPFGGRKHGYLTHQRLLGIPSNTRALEPLILMPGTGETHKKYFFREWASPDSS